MGKMIKILVLFSLIVSASPAFAQSPYFNITIYSEKYPEVLLPVQEALVRAKADDAQKMFNEAIEELTKAISIQQDQGYLLYARGSEYCNKALELGVNGKTLDKGDSARILYKKAIEDYTKAIALEPENARYYYRRGNSYVLLGDDPNAALSDYSTAIKLDSANPGYYAARANVYGVTLQYEQALADYDKAISLKTDNAEYYAGRASLDAKTGDYGKAYMDYNQAISLNPNNAQYYVQRGLLYKFIKIDSAKTLDDFSKAIALSPGEALYYSYRGACYRSVHNWLKAKEDFLTSCKQGIKPDCATLSEINGDIARGDKWVFFGATAHSNYYYDHTNVYYKNKDVVTVWTRIEKKQVQGNKLLPPSSWYTVVYSVYHCTTQENADIQIVKYNENGSELSSQRYPSIDYERVVPGSIGEILMHLLCKDNNAPVKIKKQNKKGKSRKTETY